MTLSFSIQTIIDNWPTYLGILVGVIAVFVILAWALNSGRYAARYNAFYKKIDKTATKRYNSNLVIESLLANDAKDQTNTFKSFKPRGRRKVTQYLEFYVKNLPELVVLKSYISPDKNRNELAIMLLDETDHVLYRWDPSKKVKGLIKAANKYQMMTTILGFLYELPMNINESVPLRFTNHDNDYTMTYEITKNAKKTKTKIKEKKLTHAERKAQEKVEKMKAKKLAKIHR